MTDLGASPELFGTAPCDDSRRKSAQGAGLQADVTEGCAPAVDATTAPSAADGDPELIGTAACDDSRKRSAQEAGLPAGETERCAPTVDATNTPVSAIGGGAFSSGTHSNTVPTSDYSSNISVEPDLARAELDTPGAVGTNPTATPAGRTPAADGSIIRRSANENEVRLAAGAVAVAATGPAEPLREEVGAVASGAQAAWAAEAAVSQEEVTVVVWRASPRGADGGAGGASEPSRPCGISSEPEPLSGTSGDTGAGFSRGGVDSASGNKGTEAAVAAEVAVVVWRASPRGADGGAGGAPDPSRPCGISSGTSGDVDAGFSRSGVDCAGVSGGGNGGAGGSCAKKATIGVGLAREVNPNRSVDRSGPGGGSSAGGKRAIIGGGGNSSGVDRGVQRGGDGGVKRGLNGGVKKASKLRGDGGVKRGVHGGVKKASKLHDPAGSSSSGQLKRVAGLAEYIEDCGGR